VISEGWELLDGRVDGEAEAAAEEGRRRTSVGRSVEGFEPGWDRGAPVGSGEARQGVEESGEGLLMAAHGEQRRRQPWQRVALIEEVEEGRKGRGGGEQKSKGVCGLI
jgi:hypothetical protein